MRVDKTGKLLRTSCSLPIALSSHRRCYRVAGAVLEFSRGRIGTRAPVETMKVGQLVLLPAAKSIHFIHLSRWAFFIAPPPKTTPTEQRFSGLTPVFTLNFSSSVFTVAFLPVDILKNAQRMYLYRHHRYDSVFS